MGLNVQKISQALLHGVWDEKQYSQQMLSLVHNSCFDFETDCLAQFKSSIMLQFKIKLLATGHFIGSPK